MFLLDWQKTEKSIFEFLCLNIQSFLVSIFWLNGLWLSFPEIEQYQPQPWKSPHIYNNHLNQQDNSIFPRTKKKSIMKMVWRFISKIFTKLHKISKTLKMNVYHDFE
jgi:hypothetical protein